MLAPSPAAVPSLREILRSPSEFAKLLTIVDFDANEIRLNHNWVQKHYLANRTPRDLILKPRQEGLSTAIQAEAFRYCMTRRINILTLMDIADNTEVMRRKQQMFYETFPAGLVDTTEINPETYYTADRGTDSKIATVYSTGAIHKMATAGRLSVGRSDSLNMIHFSEAAYYKDLYSVRVSAGQAGRPFWMVLESTANGAAGDFHDLVMTAHDTPDKSDWKLHFYAWFHIPTNRIPLDEGETLEPYADDELALITLHNVQPEQIKWRRAKIRAVGYKFPQEYPESVKGAFISSIVGMFGPLEGAFKAPLNATRQPGVKYRAGIDWGQADDYTVATVWRTDRMQQVGVFRARHIPEPEIYAGIVDLFKAFGVEYALSEYNGIGRPHTHALQRALDAANVDTLVVPFVMDGTPKENPEIDGTPKADLIMSYNDDLKAGAELLPYDFQISEHKAFQSKPNGRGRWEYGAPAIPGAHDDSVIANALARRAMNKVLSRAVARVRNW